MITTKNNRFKDTQRKKSVSQGIIFAFFTVFRVLYKF